MTAFVVIPVLNEAAVIAPFIADLRSSGFVGIVVVDGGSTDGTQTRAQDAGAELLIATSRGYGRAVMLGASRAVQLGATSITFVDGNGIVGAEQAARVAQPVQAGEADVAIGCRAGNELRPLQRLGNRLAIEVIAKTHGVRYRDIASVRAIATKALDELGLDDLGYGWPLQLHARAAARHLRILQIPITVRPRRTRSKVSGTLRGKVGAGVAFLRVLARECVFQK